MSGHAGSVLERQHHVLHDSQQDDHMLLVDMVSFDHCQEVSRSQCSSTINQTGLHIVVSCWPKSASLHALNASCQQVCLFACVYALHYTALAAGASACSC